MPSVSILLFSTIKTSSFGIRKGLENEGFAVTQTESIKDTLLAAERTAPQLLIIELQDRLKECRSLLKLAKTMSCFSGTEIILLGTGSFTKAKPFHVYGLGTIQILPKSMSLPVILNNIKLALKNRVPLSVAVDPDSVSKVHVELRCEIVSTNSIGFIVKAPLRIGAKTILEFKSSPLSQHGLTSCVFQKTPVLPQPAGVKNYFNEISVVGINPSIAMQLHRVAKPSGG